MKGGEAVGGWCIYSTEWMRGVKRTREGQTEMFFGLCKVSN